MKKIIIFIILLIVTLFISACTPELPEPQAKEYLAPANIDDAMRAQTLDLLLTLIEERGLLNQKVESAPDKTVVAKTFQDFAITLELMLYEYPQADPNLEAYILDSSKIYAEYANFLDKSEKGSQFKFISEGITLLATTIRKDENTGIFLWREETLNEAGSNAAEKETGNKLQEWALNTKAIVLYLNNTYDNALIAPTPTIIPPTVLPAPTENNNPEISISDCTLRIGQSVHLLAGSRIWTEPNVAVAAAIDGVPGGEVYILQGPLFGRIRHNIDTSGWWWQVSYREDDIPAGWVWEAHFSECQ
ncbi:MAG: hypothetical protein HN736_16095 [Anaerolineae bacterium]|jgi:hypothetical protein|nr:hypothetical protein [Anaerolineae bacterium]MBT4312603.1 hypothetical protein [Anaerolineae bacterium]MBT4456723.1 hypothetical protein [Anaerolineae bacterium]MBT4841529.1 hypothetical protein [Anaerolineae bacterium]MBT6060911.1 hypothetical protein [Anaerolineae bacterium]